MTWKLVTAFRKIAPEEISTFKVDYDKKSIQRPAWVHLKNSDGMIGMIGLTGGKGKQTLPYRVYLRDTFPLFLPTDYTPEEMRKFYDKFSEVYDKYNADKKPIVNLILKGLNLTKKCKVLELGAGTGLTAIPFVRAGHILTLMDFSEKMLNIAKKRKELKNCTFVQADIRKFTSNEKYDVIYSIFSFGSNSYFKVSEMSKLYYKIAGMLKPEGKLALFRYNFEPSEKLFAKLNSGIYDMYDKHFQKWAIWKKK